MISNVNFFVGFMGFTIFLKISTSLPSPPKGYDIKKVQWGVNQEQLKLVPREEDETSQGIFPESNIGSCTCGKCADCQRKMIFDILQNRKFIGASQDLNFPYYELYGDPSLYAYNFNLQKNIDPRYTASYDVALPGTYFPINNYYPY